MLKVDIAGAQSKISETEALTSGRVGLQCSFSFDDAWDGLQKVAVFEAGDTARDVAMISDTVIVPHEVMANDGVSLHVGVCGKLADGTIVIPTVYANFGRIVSGANPSGQGGTDPTPDVVAQILEAANTAVETADEALASSSAATADIADLFATKAPVIINTASGEIASFTDGADGMPVKRLEVAINQVQAGSGDPSPDNVRPISGWTGANIVVSPTQDAADGTTYPISWETEAGTVYGGTLDVATGLLTVDAELRSFTGNDVRVVSSASGYATIVLGAYGYIKFSDSCISNLLTQSTKTAASIPPGGFNVINSQGYNRAQIILKLNFTSATKEEQLAKYEEQLDEWSDAGTPLQVLYFLSAPRVYQLTPQEVTTLLGENNVWADTGEITAIDYPADTRLYIDQKIAAIMATISET